MTGREAGGSWGRAVLATAAAVLAVWVTGCSSEHPRTGAGTGAKTPGVGPKTAGTPRPPGAAVARPSHVVVLVFENKGYEQVVGRPEARYLNSLAAAGADFTDAHGLTHPSQPNYIALFSGSTQGVTDNACPYEFAGRANLGRQMMDAGLSFAGYSEGLPATGHRGCASDRYRRKHNPWVGFDTVPAGANRPYTAFPTDYGRLPTVSFVIPDMCDDMHDCPVRTGDDWLREHLGGYVRWASTHNSLLIVTFDEDHGTGANHIPTIFIGPMVRPGAYSQRIDHYRVLRTLEDMYGLPALGGAAAANAITGIWLPRRG